MAAALQQTGQLSLARPKPGVLRVSKIALLWFGIAFAVRLAALLAVHVYSQQRGYGGFYPLASGHDDRLYWDFAVLLVNGEAPPYLPSGYPVILAALFSLTGPNLLLGKLLNVVAGALTVYIGVLLVQALARTHPERRATRAAHWGGFLLCFYPSLLFYATQLVKDPILVLFGIWGLYLQVRFFQRPRWHYAVLWVVAFGGLYVFRNYAALALALSLMVFVLRWRRRWLIPLALLAAVGPWALGFGPFAWKVAQPWLNAENIANFRTTRYSVGGSAAGNQIDFTSPIGFVTSYPASLATAMFGPFPWQLSSLGQAIALVEALGIWLFIPLWLRGVLREGRGRLSKWRNDGLLLVFSLVLIGMVALFSDNIGANTRLRLLPWSAFLLYVALRLPSVRLPKIRLFS